MGVFVCVSVCVCVCVCVCTCVYVGGDVCVWMCVCVRARALRIVSADKDLHFTNALIIILSLRQCSYNDCLDFNCKANGDHSVSYFPAK